MCWLLTISPYEIRAWPCFQTDGVFSLSVNILRWSVRWSHEGLSGNSTFHVKFVWWYWCFMCFFSLAVWTPLSLFLFGTHLHWIHKPLGYFGVLDTYVIICHHILTILQIVFGIFSSSLCRSNFLDPLKLSKCVLESTDDGTNCPNIPNLWTQYSKPM